MRTTILVTLIVCMYSLVSAAEDYCPGGKGCENCSDKLMLKHREDFFNMLVALEDKEKVNSCVPKPQSDDPDTKAAKILSNALLTFVGKAFPEAAAVTAMASKALDLIFPTKQVKECDSECTWDKIKDKVKLYVQGEIDAQEFNNMKKYMEGFGDEYSRIVATSKSSHEYVDNHERSPNFGGDLSNLAVAMREHKAFFTDRGHSPLNTLQWFAQFATLHINVQLLMMHSQHHLYTELNRELLVKDIDEYAAFAQKSVDDQITARMALIKTQTRRESKGSYHDGAEDDGVATYYASDSFGSCQANGWGLHAVFADFWEENIDIGKGVFTRHYSEICLGYKGLVDDMVTKHTKEVHEALSIFLQDLVLTPKDNWLKIKTDMMGKKMFHERMLANQPNHLRG